MCSKKLFTEKTYVALIRGNKAGTLFLCTVLSGHPNILMPFGLRSMI